MNQTLFTELKSFFRSWYFCLNFWKYRGLYRKLKPFKDVFWKITKNRIPLHKMVVETSNLAKLPVLGMRRTHQFFGLLLHNNLNYCTIGNIVPIWEWWNLLYRFYHRIFGKIKCNYPDYLFQSTFQCCLWTSGVCAKGFWLSRVDSIILMVWWQEGHPISSINLASSKSVSKPHVFTPSNRDLPHQILAWLFHCCPVLSCPVLSSPMILFFSTFLLKYGQG